jgi:hypothetical protein
MNRFKVQDDVVAELAEVRTGDLILQDRQLFSIGYAGLDGAIWHDSGGVGTKLGNDLGNTFRKAKCVVNGVNFSGEFTESATRFFPCSIDAHAPSLNWSIWRREKPYLGTLEGLCYMRYHELCAS